MTRAPLLVAAPAVLLLSRVKLAAFIAASFSNPAPVSVTEAGVLRLSGVGRCEQRGISDGLPHAHIVAGGDA